MRSSRASVELCAGVFVRANYTGWTCTRMPDESFQPIEAQATVGRACRKIGLSVAVLSQGLEAVSAWVVAPRSPQCRGIG